MNHEYRSCSFEDTVKYGKDLGKSLSGGDVIVLTGVLGSGKTAFTKGLAEALGVSDVVTSPSFAIMNEYRGRLRLFHFDFYRIEDPAEMEDLLEDYVYRPDAITVIEWGERVIERLDSFIKISITLNNTCRHLSISRSAV
jgi:tRNA threonylcarbamoyladenosine biosynthesis protein TsaE